MKQKFENLGVILSRSAQKKIGGGLEEDPGGGTCQGLWTNPDPGGPNVRLTGLSIGDASNANVHWCCDSCCTASWADHSGC